ncbi:MAG: hypothetical protein SGJ27_10480 [Candidatus Melainabacteria bacterium]|nr:hypothetical protein [Candidatus Melainabacteria bacterium]
MAKNRLHIVNQKKKKSATHCGTITSEDIRLMDNAHRRRDRIESGISPVSGTGAHGGNKTAKNRKARRDGKVSITKTNW